jgi:hypothetical protein
MLKRPPRRPPAGAAAPPRSPEQQVQKIEAERLRGMSNAPQWMPSSPLTNAPGR